MMIEQPDPVMARNAKEALTRIESEIVRMKHLIK